MAPGEIGKLPCPHGSLSSGSAWDETELDALAKFYHQSTPGPWTKHYPCPVEWPNGLTLEEKRRKIGQFIGVEPAYWYLDLRRGLDFCFPFLLQAGESG